MSNHHVTDTILYVRDIIRKLEREKSVSLKSKDEVQGAAVGCSIIQWEFFTDNTTYPLPSSPRQWVAQEENSLWEPSCTVGGGTNWHSHSAEQYGVSLKNQKMKLPLRPIDPAPGHTPGRKA